MRIVNDIQTNGVLVDERWCQFFKQHGFFVGLSLDGPELLHNHYRKKRSGQGTFDKVMAAVEKLRAYEVPFATLTCVNNLNAEHPLEVYRFLRDVVKPSQIQFIPVVDRVRNLGTRSINGFAIQNRQSSRYLLSRRDGVLSRSNGEDS